MQFTYNINRLTLQVLSEANASLVLDFYKRNQDFFSPFDPIHPKEFYTLDYHESTLKAEQILFLKGKSIRYYLFENESQNKIVGTVCFSHIEFWPYKSCNIGYRLDKTAQKKGYAFESLSFLIPILFSEHQVNRMEAEILPDNNASIRLIEQLGFYYEGISRSSCEIDGLRKDHLRYSLLSTDLMPSKYEFKN